MQLYKYLLDRYEGKAPKGAKRSSKWRKVRKVHLKKYPRCAVCGLKKKVEVHHIIPFHIAPELELELSNLTTLCQNKKYGINCHLLMGHVGNYRKVNPTYEHDSREWRTKLGGAIKDGTWVSYKK